VTRKTTRIAKKEPKRTKTDPPHAPVSLAVRPHADVTSGRWSRCLRPDCHTVGPVGSSSAVAPTGNRRSSSQGSHSRSRVARRRSSTSTPRDSCPWSRLGSGPGGWGHRSTAPTVWGSRPPLPPRTIRAHRRHRKSLPGRLVRRAPVGAGITREVTQPITFTRIIRTAAETKRSPVPSAAPQRPERQARRHDSTVAWNRSGQWTAALYRCFSGTDGAGGRIARGTGSALLLLGEPSGGESAVHRSTLGPWSTAERDCTGGGSRGDRAR